MRTFSFKYQFWEMGPFLGAFWGYYEHNFGAAFLDFSYYLICVVFLLIQSARGKISILMKHMVLNCGLNPSVRNSTRSFTHSTLVSIKKYLSWLDTSIENQCADVSASVMLFWTSFDKSEWGQRERRQGVKQLWKPRNVCVSGCSWGSSGFSLNMRCL